MDLATRVHQLESQLAAVELQAARQRDILNDCEQMLLHHDVAKRLAHRSDYRETLDAIRNERQLAAEAPPVVLAYLSTAPDDFCFGLGFCERTAVAALGPYLRESDTTYDLIELHPGKGARSFLDQSQLGIHLLRKETT